MLIFRCYECDKLQPEFVKAAAVLKDHDPPVVFAEVCSFNIALCTCVCYRCKLFIVV